MAKWQSRPLPRGKLNQEFPKSTRGRKRWLLWSYPRPPQRNHYLNVFVGNRHNKSLFWDFRDGWFFLTGVPHELAESFAPTWGFWMILFVCCSWWTLCVKVYDDWWVIIKKRGWKYRKRQNEAKDNRSKEDVKAKVLLEGKGHLVEIVEDHFLWNHCHI